VLPGKCPTKPIAIGVEIDQVFLAVFLEVDLVGGIGLRDEYDDVQFIESTRILLQLLLEVVYRVLFGLLLSQQEPHGGDGQQHCPVPPVPPLELVVGMLGTTTNALPNVRQAHLSILGLLFILALLLRREAERTAS
jgi:hypothetical protein